MADPIRDLPRTEKGLQTFVMNLRPAAERKWLALGGGLTLCLEPSGGKTFQARIRRQGEKNARRVRIGSFPALSIADAKRKLGEMKAIAREGRDPALERRRARAGAALVRTLGDLIAEYLRRRREQIAVKTLKLETELLEGLLVPALGTRLLSDLAPIDFGAAIEAYAKKLKAPKRGRPRKLKETRGTNANKLLAVTRRMFKAARGWGLLDIADPTAGLSRPVKESPRDRILFDGRVLVGPDPSVNELGILVGALQDDDFRARATRSTRIALLLTVIMGFRALEVCALERRAVNLDSAGPTVTVTRSKTRAGLRTLPLPGLAVDLLSELPAGRGGAFLFPAEEGSRRTAHLHPESLSRAFARTCERLGIEGATLHDLRRTCLSGLIELGHEAVAERIAGHTPRHVLGRHYDRSARLEPMRAALEAWAQSVLFASSNAAEAHENSQEP
jgi:integrase